MRAASEVQRTSLTLSLRTEAIAGVQKMSEIALFVQEARHACYSDFGALYIRTVGLGQILPHVQVYW